MNDSAPTAATANFRPTKLHGKYAIALKADIADFDFFAS
jgi:hypothetical protein